MKDMFNKSNKIMSVVGCIALIVLMLITVCFNGDTVGGIWGTIGFICFISACIWGVLVIISSVLGIIDGIKKDKVTFFKKVLSNFMLFATVNIIIYAFEYLNKSEDIMKFELRELIFRVLMPVFVLIGIEYANKNRRKEDNV